MPKRIDNRQRGTRAFCRLQSLDHARDHGGGDEGAGAIVNQHEIRGGRRDRLQTCTHRGRTARTPYNRSAQPGVLDAAERVAVAFTVLLMDHDRQVRTVGMRKHRFHSAAQNGFPIKINILFGLFCPGPGSAARCDDQPGKAHQRGLSFNLRLRRWRFFVDGATGLLRQS
ncbi:MAG: hypothetical protein AAFQ33_00720 [Pseudomonadota bacterium]